MQAYSDATFALCQYSGSHKVCAFCRLVGRQAEEEGVRTWTAEDWRMPPFTITGFVTKSRLSSFEERELRELASVMSDRSCKVEVGDYPCLDFLRFNLIGLS